jgi:hypothetical protein
MSGSLWNLAIPAAIGLGSALIGSNASKKAADTAAASTAAASDATLQANRESLDYLREGRDLGRADLAPYQQAGLSDYYALRDNVGTSFQESPGYQFAVQEGVNAIDRGASARGLLNSGARLRELTRYGTGMANQEYNNWLSRLQSLAGVGQTATGQASSLAAQTGNMGAGLIQNAGNNVAQQTMQGGQAQASGQIGVANSTLGGIQQGVGLYALMNQPSWGNVRPTTTGSVP